MKLFEILEEFDQEYYDYLQDEMKRKKFDRYEDLPSEDVETSMQDFIISKFEAGNVTYDQALQELKKITPDDELFFYHQELDSAQDLMDD